jgi:hypothetical protein
VFEVVFIINKNRYNVNKNYNWVCNGDGGNMNKMQ